MDPVAWQDVGDENARYRVAGIFASRAREEQEKRTLPNRALLHATPERIMDFYDLKSARRSTQGFSAEEQQKFAELAERASPRVLLAPGAAPFEPPFGPKDDGAIALASAKVPLPPRSPAPVRTGASAATAGPVATAMTATRAAVPTSQEPGPKDLTDEFVSMATEPLSPRLPLELQSGRPAFERPGAFESAPGPQPAQDLSSLSNDDLLALAQTKRAELAKRARQEQARADAERLAGIAGVPLPEREVRVARSYREPPSPYASSSSSARTEAVGTLETQSRLETRSPAKDTARPEPGSAIDRAENPTHSGAFLAVLIAGLAILALPWLARFSSLATLAWFASGTPFLFCAILGGIAAVNGAMLLLLASREVPGGGRMGTARTG